ncbi:MAG: invasion associated locus B family protein [Bauldia sp.]
MIGGQTAQGQELVRSTHGDWEVRCSTPIGAAGEQCSLNQRVMADDQPGVGLHVIVLKTADKKARILRVLAPLGVLLPTGLGLRVTRDVKWQLSVTVDRSSQRPVAFVTLQKDYPLRAGDILNTSGPNLSLKIIDVSADGRAKVDWPGADTTRINVAQIDEYVGLVGFVRCLPGGCVAEVMLEDELVSKLRNGGNAVFIVYKTPEEGIGIPITLKGFGEGFDVLP